MKSPSLTLVASAEGREELESMPAPMQQALIEFELLGVYQALAVGRQERLTERVAGAHSATEQQDRIAEVLDELTALELAV